MINYIFVDVKKLEYSKTKKIIEYINSIDFFVILLSNDKISFQKGYQLGIKQLIIDCIPNNSDSIEKYIDELEEANSVFPVSEYRIVTNAQLSEKIQSYYKNYF